MGSKMPTKTKAEQIAGHLSNEELSNVINELEAKDFLWLENEIEMLRAAKSLLRYRAKGFANE